LEVALELEGEAYWRRLRKMRREALKIMELLEKFSPRLVGSVWRGVIKPGSDIDIELDCSEPSPVTEILKENGYSIKSLEEVRVPEPLREGSLWRIETETESRVEVEIILKEHQYYSNPPLCDIYGDPKKGLTLTELEKIMDKKPDKLFTPRRKKNGNR